ncbi:hypothetical protein D8674_008498 [Pyrus ussuriensis x Pyrus communis]|uniref:Uncharacterized protein n=1 Tax=Pyrus ussuriensis x Pyrus communis TaxID=2448454 RepID=A0A5N5HT79_9ROSA|nr:hypothetical protein D8674_008498 [Pyrus ussuriensis x Pyrus communis]
MADGYPATPRWATNESTANPSTSNASMRMDLYGELRNRHERSLPESRQSRSLTQLPQMPLALRPPLPTYKELEILPSGSVLICGRHPISWDGLVWHSLNDNL